MGILAWCAQGGRAARAATLLLAVLTSVAATGCTCCDPCGQQTVVGPKKPPLPFRGFKLTDDDGTPTQVLGGTFKGCTDAAGASCSGGHTVNPLPASVSPTFSTVASSLTDILSVRLSILATGDTLSNAGGPWVVSGYYLRQIEVKFTGWGGSGTDVYSVAYRLQKYKDPNLANPEVSTNLEWTAWITDTF